MRVLCERVLAEKQAEDATRTLRMENAIPTAIIQIQAVD